MHAQGAVRDQIMTLLDAGDAASAVVTARQLLRNDPQNADVTGLLALALEEEGDRNSAIDQLRYALTLSSDIAIHLRNLSNLVLMLYGAKRRDEIVPVLRENWRAPEAVRRGSKESHCLATLADILSALKQEAEIASLLLPVARQSKEDWAIVKRVAIALADIDRPEDALKLVDLDVHHEQGAELQAVMARLHAAMNRSAEAASARKAYVAAAPAYIAPASATHAFVLGVINPTPSMEHFGKPEPLLHFHSNYPSQLARLLADRYRFASVFAGSGQAAVEMMRRVSPAVVINNQSNAEVLRSGDNLSQVEKLLKEIGAPVINHPRQAVHCTRQENSSRFAGIENVVVPLVKRYSRDVSKLAELIQQIESRFEYPLIVRTTGAQEAVNMFRIEHRANLQETLTRLTDAQIYVIQYAGKPRLMNCFRRLRAAFVEGEPVLMRADYSANWIVQGRKHEAVQNVYKAHPEVRADADDIVARPDERLGESVLQALRGIARLMPLDVFGMDFDVDGEGRVIFFEANATMNLFSTAPAHLAYPARADADLLGLLDNLISRRSGIQGNHVH